MPPGRGESGERPQDAPHQALRADGRHSWDKMLAWLRRHAKSDDPVAFTKEMLKQHARFEVAMTREAHDLVANPLLWNDDERDFALWVETTYHAFSRTAAAVLDRLLSAGEGTPAQAAISMAALALATGGSAIKWGEIAGDGRRTVSLYELQRVFERAEESQLAEYRASLPFLDEETSLTVTAHYARVRILDALCSGAIGRQKAAIVDCWLREWVPEYRLVPPTVAGAHLRVGSRAPRGLHGGQEEAGETPQRVLLIEPMAGQIDTAVRWFHEGRIYPGHGVATQLRVEEHVGVVDLMRAFFETARKGLPERRQREGREARVEVYAGLPEILAKAFAYSAGGRDAPVRAAALSPLAASAAQDSPGRARHPIDMQYEVQNRTMRLLDESAGGLGLEGEEGAVPVEAGTLVAIRRAPGELPLLAEVVRRVAIPGQATRYGARVLSQDMKSITLAANGARAGVKALFLAGKDSSGRADSIVLATADFDPRTLHELRFVDRLYRIRLNRTRHRGRGWVLAGLEVVDARDAGESSSFDFAD